MSLAAVASIIYLIVLIATFLVLVYLVSLLIKFLKLKIMLLQHELGSLGKSLYSESEIK